MKVTCAHCGRRVEKRDIDVARSAGRMFCNQKCFGASRRKHKTKAQKVEEKRIYDADYRKSNRAMLKAKKADYHRRTYDPAMAAIKRKKTMPRHVAYCRRPEYRRWKSGYDKKYRAKRDFGPFADAAMLVNDLRREIKQRSTDYDIRQANQTFGKAQKRRRQTSEEQPRSRTDRKGRDGNPAPVR